MEMTVKYFHRISYKPGLYYSRECLTISGSLSEWHVGRSSSDVKDERLPDTLYNGFNVVRALAWRVSVNPTRRGNELTVSSLVAEDSGLYSCHDLKNFSRKVDFHLAVKGTSFCRDCRLIWNLLLNFVFLHTLLPRRPARWAYVSSGSLPLYFTWQRNFSLSLMACVTYTRLLITRTLLFT